MVLCSFILTLKGCILTFFQTRDAWKEVEGMEKEKAQKEYVDKLKEVRCHTTTTVSFEDLLTPCNSFSRKVETLGKKT